MFLLFSSSETSELFNVPEEVLITILGKLKLPELLSILLVNKFLNELVLSTSRLNSKLVLYFGECWCTGPKKALLNDMFDAGRSFERIKLQGIRGDNYWQRSSAIQIVVIIRKHGMNIKSLEVDNCAFNQTMLIELLEVRFTIKLHISI